MNNQQCFFLYTLKKVYNLTPRRYNYDTPLVVTLCNVLFLFSIERSQRFIWRHALIREPHFPDSLNLYKIASSSSTKKEQRSCKNNFQYIPLKVSVFSLLNYNICSNASADIRDQMFMLEFVITKDICNCNLKATWILVTSDIINVFPLRI